jgi:hypothetical protein
MKDYDEHDDIAAHLRAEDKYELPRMMRNAMVPLEVLYAQIAHKQYDEMTKSLQDSILASVVTLRGIMDKLESTVPENPDLDTPVDNAPYRWRQGGKVKRNVYSGPASGDDNIVCMCTTVEQAERIVNAVNAQRGFYPMLERIKTLELKNLEISSLERQNSNLLCDVENLEAKVSDSKGRITALERQNADLMGRIAVLVDFLEGARGSTEDALSAIEDALKGERQ